MFKVTFNDLVIIAMEIHLFPCRTQKLSPSTAEVLGGCPLGDRRVAKFWEFSSAGRASALQAEGQRFDPVNSHRSRSVAVITSPCHGEDRGFDSRRDRNNESYLTR